MRQIDSIDDLDALQGEADDFLRETLECYDNGAIEQGDLAAYGLVLNQFHNAVVDRRAAIGANAAQHAADACRITHWNRRDGGRSRPARAAPPVATPSTDTRFSATRFRNDVYSSLQPVREKRG